jgi:hypothetical protein
MANDAILKLFTTNNHVVDGGAVSADAYSVAGDVDTALDNTTNLAPLCNLILTVQYDSAPTAGQAVSFYRQDLNIVSTNDEPVVDASYLQHYVGSVVLDAVTAAQYLQITGVPLPPTSCNFYIHNGSSTAIGANDWDLDVQPYTYTHSA